MLGFLALYNVARALTGIWALRTGYDSGMDVGAAIAKSWIPRAIARVGPVAGFAVGLALPLVADLVPPRHRLGRRARHPRGRRQRAWR